MFLFISGAEIIFISFIILLVFGADKIPSIARTLAKTMTQIRNATNEIKSEIQKSSNVNRIEDSISKKVKDEFDEIKETVDDLEDSIKRKL
ncbi:MAG: sec-independent translocation protein MttA [Flavobacteriaceae bacterium]|nr:sec-independent translocation protein MttA [Flavobacteriaceae bacterium]|tara:strand:+ start:578 stop:850 length:273 start_codon:yes stop_codon:yes gene_type:complete